MTTARRLPLLLCLLCGAWYVHETVTAIVPELPHPSDFTLYYRAAQDVLAGHSPFATQGYIYPPLLAFLLTPLAKLSYGGARWAWYLLSQGCLLAAAWVMWSWMVRDGVRGWVAACTIAFVWAFGGAATESLALGQLGPLLVLLLAIAYTRSGWTPAAAGFGAALKFIPGVLATALLLRRDWRGLAILAGVALSLLVIPWALTACCLDGPETPAGTDTWTGTPATLSWSLPSVVLRILDPPTAGAKSLPRNWETGNDLPNLRLPKNQRWISIDVALATLLGGIALLTFATGGVLLDAQLPFAMAALTSLSLAAAPVGWTHYQVLQYPGVALLLSYAFDRRRWAVLGTALGCGALLYPLPVAILSRAYAAQGTFALLPTATLYLWTSVTPLAALAVFGLLVKWLHSSRY